MAGLRQPLLAAGFWIAVLVLWTWLWRSGFTFGWRRA